MPVEAALTAALIAGTFDALVLDPAVSVHRVSENDNVAIDAVAKTLGRIAGNADIAVEAVRHTRKLAGAAATIEDARGASARTAAARNVRVLNRMSTEDAARAGIEDGDERFYFRSDGDGNLSTPSANQWFHLQSIGLGNGSSGIVDDQTMSASSRPGSGRTPSMTSPSPTCGPQAKVAAGRWRESPQSKDWVGSNRGSHPPRRPNKAHRTKIKALLKMWIANGMFIVVDGMDAKRERRKFVEVGEPAND